MIFVRRCLRVEDMKDPLARRCKNNAVVNGALCEKCIRDAQYQPIYVLMNSAITQLYKIPFKNQVTVKIDLRDTIKKPNSKTELDSKIKAIKLKLMKQMGDMKIPELKDIHDMVGLKIWNLLKKQKKNNYAIRYIVSKEIVNRFVLLNKS